MTDWIEGGCLCGRVSYRLHEPPRFLVFCHCSQCRRSTGSAFNTTTVIARETLELITGGDGLVGFESPKGRTRHRCETCGSTLWVSTETAPEQLRLRVGTLANLPSGLPGFHVFVESKAPWYEILDDRQQFPRGVESGSRDEAAGDRVRREQQETA